ncbi:MAG: hypothetical protein AB1411_11625 [Nitrospirota bacterium]
MLFLALHVIAFQMWVPHRRFVTMVRIAAASGLILIAVHRTTPSGLGFLPTVYTTAGWAIDLLNALIVFVFLFVGYSMFYFLVDRGFSGRIMIEIERAPNRLLSLSEISALYTPEAILRRRLQEMLDIGRIVEKNGRYCNTAKGRSAAALFAFVKRFLQLGEGG